MRRVHCPIMPANKKSADGDAWLSQKDFWRDGAAYIATPDEAAEIDKAIATLNACYAEAMDFVTRSSSRLSKFRFSENPLYNSSLRDHCTRSWRDKDQHSYVFDRYDFAWDGGAPKLLERNVGYLGLITATGITQQKFAAWLRTRPGFADVRTVGDLKSRFIEAFRAAAADRRLRADQKIILTVHGSKRQDDTTYDPGVHYAEMTLEKWIKKAGFEATARALATDGLGHITLNDCARIVEDAGDGLFPYAGIEALAFKQYMDAPSTVSLMPAWTLLAGHKSMLPVLSRLFPDCPYILPARDGIAPLPHTASIIKFTQGVQGEEALIYDAKGRLVHDHRGIKPMRDAHNNSANFIVQALAPETKNPDGSHKVLHVFTTNGRVAAAGFREAPAAIVGGGKATKTQYVPLLIRDRDDDAPAAYLCDDPVPARAKPSLRDWLAYYVGLRQFKPE